MISNNKKILICGDSFAVPDPDYYGMHFSEKISNSLGVEVINYAAGGASNALIAMQLLQGLLFNPDFVIFTFTESDRFEFDDKVLPPLLDITPATVKEHQKSRFTSSCFRNNKQILSKIGKMQDWRYNAASDSMEKLKNYFYISMCLAVCRANNIPFCYSTGGFERQQGYQQLVEQNYIKNILDEYNDRELTINLWDHQSTQVRPWFHVSNESIQLQFAEECNKFIKDEFC